MRREAMWLLAFGAMAGCATDKGVLLPMTTGDYTFVVKFAEHPHMTGGTLAAEIRGSRIRLVSQPESSVFPAGLVEEGYLLWHANTSQWIIGESEADAAATDVGGCSDGPAVVDLQQRIYWTC